MYIYIIWVYTHNIHSFTIVYCIRDPSVCVCVCVFFFFYYCDRFYFYFFFLLFFFFIPMGITNIRNDSQWYTFQKTVYITCVIPRYTRGSHQRARAPSDRTTTRNGFFFLLFSKIRYYFLYRRVQTRTRVYYTGVHTTAISAFSKMRADTAGDASGERRMGFRRIGRIIYVERRF